MSDGMLMPADARSVVAPVVTNEQASLIKATIAKDATDAELQLFFYDCRRRGVHPLDKLIHFTKRAGKYTPVTSIDYFRSRAAETREHMGTDDAVFIGTPGQLDFSATVVVYRMVQHEKCAFFATARWCEYYPGDGADGFMWKKMPHGQLGKCAEALALRKAFPQQLADLHTFEEMDQAGTDNREPMPPRGQAPQRKSAPPPSPAQSIGPVYVVDVTTKSGESNGKAWTIWRVKLSDGREATTFHEGIGLTAQALKQSGAPCEMTTEPGKKAGSLNIVELAAAEREPGSDDA